MAKKVKWKYFERVVAAIHHAESKGATVIWNDIIQGRQFDVTVRFKFGLHDYLTVIECKNYSKKIAVEKIDALVTKARDVNADKAIVVSSSGFQSGCFDVAKRHGIKLLTLNEKINTNIDDLIAYVTPALNIYDVRLKLANSSQYFMFEDIGGKLQYLMDKTRIVAGELSQSPNQIIYDWQKSGPNLLTDKENDITILFPDNTFANIPNEKPLKATSLLFKCKFYEAFVAKGLFLDNHIRQGINTSYELLDEGGNITHSISPSEFKIGFDTKLEVGKFYENPKMYSSYFCEKVENDSVSWVLIESYQHGNLLQARFTQNVKCSSYYLEITDKKKISKLKLMLEKLEKRKK